MGSGAFGLVWPITKYIKLRSFINTLTHDITSSPNMKNLILNYFETFSLLNSLITRRNQRMSIFYHIFSSTQVLAQQKQSTIYEFDHLAIHINDAIILIVVVRTVIRNLRSLWGWRLANFPMPEQKQEQYPQQRGR